MEPLLLVLSVLAAMTLALFGTTVGDGARRARAPRAGTPENRRHDDPDARA